MAFLRVFSRIRLLIDNESIIICKSKSIHMAIVIYINILELSWHIIILDKYRYKVLGFVYIEHLLHSLVIIILQIYPVTPRSPGRDCYVAVRPPFCTLIFVFLVFVLGSYKECFIYGYLIL